MKVAFVIISLILISQNIFSQYSAADSILIRPDSIMTKELIRKVDISVIPQEASNASILIIQKTKIEVGPNSKTSWEITPDTIGIWKAPVSINLNTGRYDIIANKKGFKEAIENIEIAEKNKNDITVKMLSYNYLQNKREQWSTIRWISIGVAAVGGIGMAILNHNINSEHNRYNNATSLEEIQNSREQISNSQKLYNLSSVVAFSGLGGTLLTWLIGLFYN